MSGNPNQTRTGFKKKAGSCYVKGTSTPLCARTKDKGFVFRTEVAEVVQRGGVLLPDGRMGMVLTKDRTCIVTAEYATLLTIQDRLHTLFEG